MLTTHAQQFEELAKAASLQSATPVVLALMECDPELREQAIELFQQLASGQLDEGERLATTALIADILFPHVDSQGRLGLDLVEAERLAQEHPAHQGTLHQLDTEETTFAESLKRVMDDRGLTQLQLAEKMGLGQSSISMMLKRQCRPQRKTVMKFAQALGVTPQALWPGFQPG